jgi:prolyl oligopeptidase
MNARQVSINMLALAALVLPVMVPAPAMAATPPPAAKRSVEDTYFGTTVREDYRWLEDWGSPETKAWVEGENQFTRGVLDSIPSRSDILARLTALTRSLTPDYGDLVSRGSQLFALKNQPPKNQSMLVVLNSPDNLASEKMLVDPNTLDPSGATNIDFYEPSIDGAKVAVSLSKGGTESGDVHFVDVHTGKELPDVLPRVNGGTAGGDVAWAPDGKSVWYTRYPAKGERADEDLDFYQQVWFHTLGMPISTDKYVFGKSLPKIAEISFKTSDDGRWMLIAVRNGDGGEIGFWLRKPTGGIVQLAAFTDKIVDGEFGGTGLYLFSRRSGPNGEVLRLSLEHPSLATAKVVVPTGDTAIQGINIGGTHLYVHDIVGGPSQLRMFSLAGSPLGKLPLPPISTVGGFVKLANNQVLIQRESFTEPSKWLRYDPTAGGLTATALETKSPADFSDVEVRREFAVSKDGTRVPMNILIRKGTQVDGKAPLLLYGYGGYGLGQQPGFSARRRLWLEQGGIYVVANIRGGNEYGDAWHLAGNLTNKQNVFDDFAACAQYLVTRHYTSPERMACQGGSNGGLLMGATFVQHPELFGAVVSEVGIYDMLRVELSPNGLFNTTEFGTVKDSAQFHALLAYSPYHNVKDGTQYPSLLLLTGVNDPRVSPGNSFKFAARLQASGTAKPILLRTSMTTGHIGTPLDARNQQYADIFAFLFSQLGMTYKPVTLPAP